MIKPIFRLKKNPCLILSEKSLADVPGKYPENFMCLSAVKVFLGFIMLVSKVRFTSCFEAGFTVGDCVQCFRFQNYMIFFLDNLIQKIYFFR